MRIKLNWPRNMQHVNFSYLWFYYRTIFFILNLRSTYDWISRDTDACKSKLRAGILWSAETKVGGRQRCRQPPHFTLGWVRRRHGAKLPDYWSPTGFHGTHLIESRVGMWTRIYGLFSLITHLTSICKHIKLGIYEFKRCENWLVV